MLSSLALLIGLATPPGPHAAVSELQIAHPRARAVWQADRLRLLTGLNVATQGATPRARVASFLRTYPDLVSLPGALRLEAVTHHAGRTMVRLAQYHGDRRVMDRAVVVTLDANGAVTTLTNEAAPLHHVAAATIDAARAQALVTEATGYAGPMKITPVVLALGDQGVEGYEVHAGLWIARIDAHDGQVIGVRKGWLD